MVPSRSSTIATGLNILIPLSLLNPHEGLFRPRACDVFNILLFAPTAPEGPAQNPHSVRFEPFRPVHARKRDLQCGPAVRFLRKERFESRPQFSRTRDPFREDPQRFGPVPHPVDLPFSPEPVLFSLPR